MLTSLVEQGPLGLLSWPRELYVAQGTVFGGGKKLEDGSFEPMIGEVSLRHRVPAFRVGRGWSSS